MPTMENEIYLVDGSAYIHRAYHAIRPLSTSTGLPTQAVYGFATILRRIMREKEPRYLAVAWDTRGPVFRHRIYPEYKANRPPMPEDLAVQIPYIRQLVEAYRILSMEHEDQEADDLIAAAVARLAGNGNRVIIVSGDKDLLQLVGEHVVLWDPMNDKLMDARAVEEKFGVPPELLLDYFALTGDSADNIPGVPGIGPKTAAKLIRQYGSLDGIYAALDSMKASKMKERLANHRDDALLSRRLIRLCDDVQVPDTPEAYRVQGPDDERLRNLLTELEFFSLLGEDKPLRRLDSSSFQLIGNEAELTDLVQTLAAAQQVVLDTETTSLDVHKAELVGISVCIDTRKAWYLPCGHCDEKGRLLSGQVSRTRLVETLAPFLSDSSLVKIGHNLKYDWAVLAARQNGEVRIQGDLYDTMIGAWLLEPERRSYKLDDLCRELGVAMTPYGEVTDGNGDDGAFARVSLERARDYSCEDVVGCLLLHEHQRPQLEKKGLWRLFTEVEGPLISVLARMERSGIRVDMDKLSSLAEEFRQRLGELAEEIYALAGHEFNINSSQQLARVLFEELGLPRGRKTKTGYSTDVKVLEKLSRDHELPALVLAYRNLAKLLSTYVEKLAASARNGRVHTSYNQCGTATGRLSSSDPNLQNIPIRTPEGRRIRSVFIAEPHHLLLSADYSQIDLRVLAHYSEDEALIKAFVQGDDIHRRTAAEIFQVAPELVTSEMRRVAKTINFGIVYGMSSYGLASQLKLSRKEAQRFIDRYFNLYSGVRRYMEEIVRQAREQGYVTTLMGRRRDLPDIRHRVRSKREFAERTAINTPIQGTAADIIKLAMIEVQQRLDQMKFQARMILQIHDELVLEVPEQEAEVLAELVKNGMEQVLTLKVPLVVHVKTGHNLDMEEEG